jgi:hypothetical protein
MMFVDFTTGTTTTLTWQERQNFLLRCEAALREIWGETGGFPTEKAEEVAVRCHDIANAVLHPEP